MAIKKKGRNRGDRPGEKKVFLRLKKIHFFTMKYESQNIETNRLRPNTGQVEGLPINPRKISNANLLALEKSIKNFPEFLELRPLIVIPHGDVFVAVAGNHRLRAAVNVGLEELPCLVLGADTPPERLREISLKDNKDYAEDVPDLLEFWDKEELRDWDLLPELPIKDFGDEDFDEPKKKATSKDFKVCPKCGYKWK